MNTKLNELIDQVLQDNHNFIINATEMAVRKDAQYWLSDFNNVLYSEISFKDYVVYPIIELLGIKRHQLRKNKTVKKVFLDRYNKRYFSTYPF